MSDRIPRPLAAVFFDAGETLLAPYPSFEGRFVAVAAAAGVPLDEAAVHAAFAAALRRAAWPGDWTDPATQRAFWHGFYVDVLGEVGYDGDGAPLAEELFATFSDPATYKLFDDVRPALEALRAAGVPARACLHVGDSPGADVAGARAVGMVPVLIDRHARWPEADGLRVRTLAELVDLVEGG